MRNETREPDGLPPGRLTAIIAVAGCCTVLAASHALAEGGAATAPCVIRMDAENAGNASEALRRARAASRITAPGELREVALGGTREALQYQQWFGGIEIEGAGIEIREASEVQARGSLVRQSLLEKLDIVGRAIDAIERLRDRENLAALEVTGISAVVRCEPSGGGAPSVSFRIRGRAHGLDRTWTLESPDEAGLDSLRGERRPLSLGAATAQALSLYDGTVAIDVQKESSKMPPADLVLSRGGSSGAGAIDTRDDMNIGLAGGGQSIWSPFGVGRTQASVSAHWAAQKSLEYLWTVHGRNGVNAAAPNVPPLQLSLLTHYCKQPCVADPGGNARARWLGLDGWILIGDGDGVSTGPQVGVDTIAREIIKGVQFYSVGNAQSGRGFLATGESGAIAEGLADAFGQMIKLRVKPITWITGADDVIDPALRRNLANPLASSNPDAVGGVNWVADPNAAGQAQTNATIVGRWFHLASEGGTGINSLAAVYVVPGLGADEVEKIAFSAMVSGLARNSKFVDLRFATILAARAQYGTDSQEEVSVTDAWAAVNVGVPYIDSLPFSPASAATGVPVDTALTWGPRPNESQWKVEVATSAAFGAGTQTLTVQAPSASPQGLVINTTYYWRVTGWDGKRWGTRRPVRTFTTENGSPKLLSPNGVGPYFALSHPWDLDLTWKRVGGAASYEVQVAKDSAFTQMVKAGSAPQSESPKYQVDLKMDLTHYWRVRPVFSAGPGSWSAYAVFKTAIPKLVRTSSHGGQELSPWAVPVTWQTLRGAHGYVVQYGRNQQAVEQGNPEGQAVVSSSSGSHAIVLSNANDGQTWFYRILALAPVQGDDRASTVDQFVPSRNKTKPKVTLAPTDLAWKDKPGLFMRSPSGYALQNGSAPSVRVHVSGVAGATSYRLRALRLNGDLAPSGGAMIDVTVPPNAPDGGTVELAQWTPPWPENLWGLLFWAQAIGPGAAVSPTVAEEAYCDRLVPVPALELVGVWTPETGQMVRLAWRHAPSRRIRRRNGAAGDALLTDLGEGLFYSPGGGYQSLDDPDDYTPMSAKVKNEILGSQYCWTLASPGLSPWDFQACPIFLYDDPWF